MSRLFLTAAVLLGLVTHTATAEPEEALLPPDEAFRLTTRTLDAHTLEASWEIAPGYYLYRHKFKFEALDGRVGLDEPLIPPGKHTIDKFFGATEIYVDAVRIRVPLARRDPAAGRARLRITAQGCNEPIGVCYAPIVKEVVFDLPAAAPRASPISDRLTLPVKPLRSLKGLTSALSTAPGFNEPMDPDMAFRLELRGVDADILHAHFDIDECCYLYRDKTQFQLTTVDGSAPAPGLLLGANSLPPGEIKTDPYFGNTEVYHQDADVIVRIGGTGNATAPFGLRVSYQGCSEKGVQICYPPQSQTFRVTPSAGALTVAAMDNVGFGAMPASSPAPAPTGVGARTFILSVLAAFGVGLLLTFTPCVLPMIPILSSLIIGTGDRHITKLRGGLLSLSYVLGTAVTYTATGIIAGAAGEQLQAYFQNAWAIGIFSIVFVLLALSMFGFYELQVPGFIQSRLHLRAQELKKGSFVGVFAMGLLSALIIGACVSPLFISALGVAIANRDPVLGGAIMFSMALGMGVVLILIGVGAGFLLPRAGRWMTRVKQVFGVLLLSVAIYLLSFLPEVPVLYLWAALLIVSGGFFGATQNLPSGADGWQYLWKGVGTVLLIWGVLALLGGFAGNRDILNPLPWSTLDDRPPIQSGGRSVTPQNPFEPVRSMRELESRLAAARAAARPVLLDYYASWCSDCVLLQNSTFRDPRVRQAVNPRFVLLQVDVTDPNDSEPKAIKQRFGVFGPPAMLFFAANGDEQRELRTYGYKSPEAFLELLDKI